MREAYDEAGMPKDFTIHGLHYTAATRICDVYKSMNDLDRIAWEAVADLVGHTTRQMTRRTLKGSGVRRS